MVFWGLRTSSKLFADDVFLLASSDLDIVHLQVQSYGSLPENIELHSSGWDGESAPSE